MSQTMKQREAIRAYPSTLAAKANLLLRTPRITSGSRDGATVYVVKRLADHRMEAYDRGYTFLGLIDIDGWHALLAQGSIRETWFGWTGGVTGDEGDAFWFTPDRATKPPVRTVVTGRARRSVAFAADGRMDFWQGNVVVGYIGRARDTFAWTTLTTYESCWIRRGVLPLAATFSDADTFPNTK